MKVFISWSGPRAQGLAEALNEWVQDVIQSVECFYSSNDIRAGQQWNSVINTRLGETSFGILCVTPENVDAPWLNFEAGALSKKVTDDARVVPVTLGLHPADISEGPLRQFNGVQADKSGIKKLVTSLNEAAEAKIDVNKAFERWWEVLEEKIAAIPANADAVAPPPTPTTDELLREILGIVRAISKDQQRGYSAALSASINDLGAVARAHNSIARREAIRNMWLSDDGSLGVPTDFSSFSEALRAEERRLNAADHSARQATPDGIDVEDTPAD